MEPISIGVLGVVAMLVLLGLGVHVGVGMLLVGLVGFTAISGFGGAVGLLATTPYAQTASFTFTVVPMFILMGNFVVQAGMGEDLYLAAFKFLGRLRGGLAMATVLGAAVWSACSGSSLATAATFTKIALPEMRKYKYDEGLAAGAIAASGTLDIMIPPSGVMVFLGIMTQISIGQLLIGGILPGIMTAFLYCVFIYARVRLNPQLAPPAYIPVTWKEQLSVFKSLVPVGGLFMLAIGGIYFGVFTATEGGAVGAAGAGLLALARRRLNFTRLKDALTDTVKTTAFIFLIIIGAMVFGRFLAITGVVTGFGDLMKGLDVSPVVVVLLMMGVYFILGMLMDVVAMLALTLPVFFPVVQDLGVNPIWFGILVVMMCEVAFVTPPVGLNCYVVSATGGVKMEKVFKGVALFVVADIVALALLIIFPQIATWLPSTMNR